MKKGSNSSKSQSRNVSNLSGRRGNTSSIRNSPDPKKSAKKQNNLSEDEEESIESSHHGEYSSDLHDDLISMVRHMRKTVSDLKKIKMSAGGYSTKQVMQPSRQMTMSLKLK